MLFSVVVPVYNGADYLQEAIGSVLGQKYIDPDEYEILVVNDGSNDAGETRKCAERYGSKIRYFEKENGGVSTALNLGITQAKGQYICWLSHDDLFCDDKLAIQKAAINELRRKKIENFILFSKQSFIDDRGLAVWQRKVVSKETGNFLNYSPDEAFTSLLLGKLSIGGCTIAIPRTLFDVNLAGFFSEDFRYIQDFAMWVKMALCGVTFVQQDRVLVKSRIHSGQQTGRFQDRLSREARDFYGWLLNSRNEFDIKFTSEMVGAIFFALGKYRISIFSKKSSFRLLAYSYTNKIVIRCCSLYFFGFVMGYLRRIYSFFVNLAYR